jgi:hypothetical protein
MDWRWNLSQNNIWSHSRKGFGMSDVIEKNDVDLSRLFGWGRVFEVVNPQTQESDALVYMKLLGDADLGRARVYALRKSAELRRKLKDTNSDEYLAWVRDISEVEVQDLINLITVFSMREVSKNAREKVKIPTPKPPKTTANLEKMEDFQKQVDAYPEKRAKAIEDAVTKEIAILQKSLKEKSKEELYRQYVKMLTDEFCERIAVDAFEDYQTYLGCYSDDTYKADKRFFEDFEAFDNLEPTIKLQFKDAYRSLDIELSELKKLRRATQ